MGHIIKRRRLSPSYCAGLVDGDGMISIRKMIKKTTGADTYTMFCCISNCYIPILEELKRKYGGRVHVSVRAGAKKNWRPEGFWIVVSKEANQFLQQIEPYLIIKKIQVQLALAFWKVKKPFHNTNVQKPDGFVQKCRRFHEMMLRLNKKGLPRDEFRANLIGVEPVPGWEYPKKPK